MGLALSLPFGRVPFRFAGPTEKLDICRHLAGKLRALLDKLKAQLRLIARQPFDRLIGRFAVGLDDFDCRSVRRRGSKPMMELKLGLSVTNRERNRSCLC